MLVQLVCFFILAFSSVAFAEPSAQSSPASFVNPFIGTADSGVRDAVPGGKGGATFPGAVVPFGMVQVGPDTDKPETSGFNFANNAIRAFSFTHLSGPGCRNGGEFPFMPILGRGNWAANSPSPFLRDKQTAAPGYYQVQLENGINVEVTATVRTALTRLQFPESQEVSVLFHTGFNGVKATQGQIRTTGTRSLTGWMNGGGFCNSKTSYKIFFAVEFDRESVSRIADGSVMQITFANTGAPLLMKVGLSYVSEEGARLNLINETRDFAFDRVRSNAFQAWSQALSTIQISGPAETDTKTVFYTALYHSLLHPNVGSDVDGRYIGFDNQIHRSARTHYVNFSGWDMYRSQVQLIALLFPKRAADIAQSLVDSAVECGSYPKWALNNTETNIMVGDPGALSVANLYAFGARNFDYAKALMMMKKSALDPKATCQNRYTRPGLSDYMSLGYVRLTDMQWGAAATALEWASADYGIAQFAAAVGDREFAKQMRIRSENWKNNWDPILKAIRPKLDGGKWLEPFDMASMRGFVEGNSAQYTWMIPHDLGTLIEKMGGDQAAIARLDEFMSEANAGQLSPRLYLGNEPAFGVPWTYMWARAPSLAQKKIRQLMNEQFLNAPNGLAGNDDLGALSSWYVWAALGLYPQIPGNAGFVISSPAFSRITVAPESGKPFQIMAENAEREIYISALDVGGKPWARTWISLAQLQDAKLLRFTMKELPQLWGSEVGDEPPSDGALNSTELW